MFSIPFPSTFRRRLSSTSQGFLQSPPFILPFISISLKHTMIFFSLLHPSPLPASGSLRLAQPPWTKHMAVDIIDLPRWPCALFLPSFLPSFFACMNGRECVQALVLILCSSSQCLLLLLLSVRALAKLNLWSPARPSRQATRASMMTVPANQLDHSVIRRLNHCFWLGHVLLLLSSLFLTNRNLRRNHIFDHVDVPL